MKNLMILLVALVGTTVFGQKSPVDKKEETKTKIVKVKSEKDTIETRMQVKTTEEQEVRTVKDPNHPINQDQVKTPKKIIRTTTFDLEDDPFYDKTHTEKYYTYDDKTYKFEPNSYGFAMKDEKSDSQDALGKARLTSVSRFYLIETDGHNGIGYFNENGTFVVEYYDPIKNIMVVKEYVSKE